MGCGSLLATKEHVVLFDGGLRIESAGRVLYKNRWKKRYVVCQRRNGSEAPLIGLFKNDKAREKGQHLELFYMQNYIGYEYGFRVGQTTKTLALLMENRTLVLSFFNGECMIFWKEWLRDVCGRSLIYCMTVNNMPRTAILQLSGNDVRIHLTKTMLVVVQSSPPAQLACLNLRNLNRVECAEGELTFEANARSWLKHHSFSFTGEHTVQISRALRLLLRPDQFLTSGSQNQADSFQINSPHLTRPQMISEMNMQSHHPNAQQPQSGNLDFVTHSMPLLPHHPLRSHTPTIATTPAQTLPLPPRRRWMNENQWANLHHYVNTRVSDPHEKHKLLTHDHSVLSQSLASLMQQTSMASALTMPSEMEAFDERQYYNLNIVHPQAVPNWTPTAYMPPPIPPRKATLNETTLSDNTSPSSQHSGEAESTPGGTEQPRYEAEQVREPAEVPLLATAPATSNTPTTKTGLVKPYVPESLMIPARGIESTLLKRLDKEVTGRFDQYDGDRQARGYTEESEMFHDLMSSIPVAEVMRKRTSTVGDSHFSLSSSSRIEQAVQKRREHLRQKEKRLSQMEANRMKISSSGSSSSSAYQAFPSPAFVRTIAYSQTPPGSTNTLIHSQQASSQDDRESRKTAIYQEQRKFGVSHDTTPTQAAVIDELESEAESTVEGSPRTRGISTVSLPAPALHSVKHAHPMFHISSGSNYNGSLASIQSELNERIVFERGGRSRTSGRSTGKSAEKRTHPSSLNYVAIDSSTDWLQNYRKPER